MEDFVFYPSLFQVKPIDEAQYDEIEIKKTHKFSPDQRFIERLVDYIELYAEKFKNKDSFHNLLIKYFSESGLTQKELSERANVSYTTLNKVLNKKKNIDNISLNYILKLCLAMNLDIDETQKLLLFSGYVLTGKDDREIYLRLAIKNKLGVVKTNLYLDENNLQLL
jgi:transcriptional regulator with XRE-family HTH domain